MADLSKGHGETTIVGKVQVFDGAGALVSVATEATLAKLPGLSIPIHDYIALTYVAAGNGVGEIETVVFKTGGSGGTTVATLTLTYNASNEIATITKT